MYIGIGAIVIIVIIVLVILMLRRLCCADAPEPPGQDRPGGLQMEDQVGARLHRQSAACAAIADIGDRLGYRRRYLISAT